MTDMGVTVTWDDHYKKTIIRYDFTDPWTLQDLLAAVAQDDDMVDSVDHKFHAVFNFQESHNLPPNPISHLQDLANSIRIPPGLIILVGATIWQQMLGEIFKHLHGRSIEGFGGLKFVSTLDEARALVAAYEQHN